MTEKSGQQREFSWPVRVYIEDTDAGGIVYYVNYLKYMERARTEYLRTLGYQQHSLARENRLFVVHSAQLQYREPARLDQQLQVTAQLDSLGKASLEFVQQVRHEQRVLCQARVKVACVAADSFRPQALPGALYDAFKACLISDC